MTDQEGSSSLPTRTGRSVRWFGLICMLWCAAASALGTSGTARDIPDDSATRQKMEKALGRAGEVMAEGRDRVLDLRVPADTMRDLPESFRALGEELAAGRSITFSMVAEGHSRDLVGLVKDEVYRIGREALINAFRHAAAASIEVQIIQTDADFRLRIRDDGLGIDPTALEAGSRPGHWGLSGMRERGQAIGARLDVWSRPGAGTEIELTIAAAVAYRATLPVRRWFGRWRMVRATQ